MVFSCLFAAMMREARLEGKTLAGCLALFWLEGEGNGEGWKGTNDDLST